MTRSHILIIGAMKSGTTTLFDQLAADPRIAGAHPKEPGFLAFEEVYAMGWDWYDGLFGNEGGDAAPAYALDGSTDYTKHPFVHGVRRRIAEGQAQGRSFKLIYVMREPLSRIQSHARHTQIARKEVGQFRSPRPDHSLDAGISPVNLAVSDYARQLDEWADWFDAGDLYLATTDRLRGDGQGVMDKLSSFLGLEGLTWRGEHARSNQAGGQTEDNPALAAAARVTPLRAAAKAVLPAPAREAIKQGARRRVQAEGRFRLNEAERAALAARYAPMLDRLEDRYGLAVPEGWRTSSSSAKPAC